MKPTSTSAVHKPAAGLAKAMKASKKDKSAPKRADKKAKKVKQVGSRDDLFQPPSYLIIPKGKRVATKVVTKLERENVQFAIARAADAAERKELKRRQLGLAEPEKPLQTKRVDEGEKVWLEEQKGLPPYQAWKKGREERLLQRERRRRDKLLQKEKEELGHKKYRIHPEDPYHIYLEGYVKKRHRISKRRFMTAVDVPLFKQVLFLNKELQTSPIWDEELDLRQLTFARGRILKDHLQQFEVLEEALKQGIFDKPGCDDLPLERVRRKRRKKRKEETAEAKAAKEKSIWAWLKGGSDERTSVVASAKSVTEDQEGYKSAKFVDKYRPKPRKRDLLKQEKGSKLTKLNSDEELDKKKKRRMTFPPLETREEDLGQREMTWFERVHQWVFTGNAVAPSSAPPSLPPSQKTEEPETLSQKMSLESNASDTSKRGSGKKPSKVKIMKNDESSEEGSAQDQADEKSVGGDDDDDKLEMPKVPIETAQSRESHQSEAVSAQAEQGTKEKEKAELPQEGGDAQVNPIWKPGHATGYSPYLTIKVPLDLGRKRQFIHNLVERRTKKGDRMKPPWMKKVESESEAHHPKYDPMGKLHPDEKDSDVWTITTATTTDSYASWRQPPPNRAKDLDEVEDWTDTDKTFLWRIILLLITIWEASYFVDVQLTNVYYGLFTHHLFKENIWAVMPGFSPPMEGYFLLNFQQWLHFFISVISMSIINKDNECVSLLFALSLLMDGFVKVALTAHDSLFLPYVVSWPALIFNAGHLMWKSFVICFFVGYHFYSADYIRKSREFKHRKKKLHNHEINAKGTKGIQKRKIAWDWMVQHARRTNIRALRKKYPDIKDGNFPIEDLAKELKFSEPKELRMYAQQHNFNIGYPYNKLRDMKRYVFGELEKSEYSSGEEQRLAERAKAEEEERAKAGEGLTYTKFEDWWEKEGRIMAAVADLEEMNLNDQLIFSPSEKSSLKQEEDGSMENVDLDNVPTPSQFRQLPPATKRKWSMAMANKTAHP